LSFGLKLLNLFFGLCKGVPGLPDDLKRLGFRAKSIELRFSNSDNETVVPELILASRKIGHSLIFEWKSGGNTEADQLRRYNAIERQDLVQRALLQNEECAAHDVTVICREEFQERIKSGVEQGAYPFPVLSITERGIEKIHNRFSVTQTDNVFNPVLEIDWNLVPTGFFVVDGASSEAEYTPLVLQYVLRGMEQGTDLITALEIARSIVPLWITANSDFRNAVEKKIVAVLTYASSNQFHRFLRRHKSAEGRTHEPTWEITENPLFDSPDKRAKIWREMRKLQIQVIEHFEGHGQQELPFDTRS
jgi:hypothetical protein